MTNKIAVIIIGAFTMVFAQNTQEPPTSDLSDLSTADQVVANVEPKQTTRDKKIWNNILKGYLGFRQLAKSGLETMESARDMAFTANKYFQTIVKIGVVGLTVIENASKIKEFFIWNQDDDWRDKFWDVIESVEFLEEDIFQNTDWLIYESPKQLHEQRLQLRANRANFVDSKNSSKAAFVEAFVGPVKRSMIYENAIARKRQAMYSGVDDAIYENTRGNEAQQRQQISQTVALKVTAGKVIKEAEIDNNVMLTDQLMAQQDPDGKASETQIAEANNILQRNIMVQKFQQHSHMTDECNVAAHILLARVHPYELRVVTKKIQRIEAIQLSGEIFK